MGFSKRKKKELTLLRSSKHAIQADGQCYQRISLLVVRIPKGWYLYHGRSIGRENVLRLALLVGSSLDSPMTQKILPEFTYGRSRPMNWGGG